LSRGYGSLRPANRSSWDATEKEKGRKVFSPCQIPEKKKRKEEKYPKWQYNQETLVWSPKFTMSTFGMANMRNATIGVLFLQFSQDTLTINFFYTI